MLKVKDSTGKIYLDNIENPACFFDRETFTLMKIGERELVEEAYNKHVSAYIKGGFKTQAEALVLIDLPKDQEILDKVFNITGYCKNLLPN